MTKLQYIQTKVPVDERLAQLAEEAAELGKAALKLRRTRSTTNPTPVSDYEAYENLIEELADVLLCLDVAGFADWLPSCARTMDEKIDRWATRLGWEDKAEEG